MGNTAAGARKLAARAAGLPVEEYERRIASGLHRCGKCCEWKSAEALGSDSSRVDGVARTCLDCRGSRARAKYVRRTRVSKLGAFFVAGRDGDRDQARARVFHQVETGLRCSANALPCTDCGREWQEGGPRHEYDHYLGYDAAHHLDVQPVCVPCHAKREMVRRSTCRRGHKRPPGTLCVECRRVRERKTRTAEWWRARRARKAAEARS